MIFSGLRRYLARRMLLRQNRPDLGEDGFYFLDDVRDPPNDGRRWIVVRSSDDALRRMAFRAPTFVSFDHDLGGDDTGMRLAHALIERDLDHDGRWLPSDFGYRVHSANPVGRANLEGLLNSYLRVRRTRASSSS